MTTRWRDPRLGIGVLLVALSGMCGAFVLSGPEKVPVYRARSAIVPGTAISKADLDVVEIDKTLAASYVGPSTKEGDIGESVEKGELLAKSRIDRSEEGGTRVVIPLMSPAPASAAPGARVELWRVARQRGGNAPAAASLVALDVLVVSVNAESPNAGGRPMAEVEMPDQYVRQVLAAMGSDDGYVLAGRRR